MRSYTLLAAAESVPSSSKLPELIRIGFLVNFVDSFHAPTQVVVVEQDHCGQFSYPTIQYVPENGMIFVAYTVLFLPASMPPDCRVRRPGLGLVLITSSML